MKTPLHIKLTEWLKEKRGAWVRKSDVEAFGASQHTYGYTAVRRMQEITQATHRNFNPDIEHRYKDKVVWYRFMPLEGREVSQEYQKNVCSCGKWFCDKSCLIKEPQALGL